MSRAQQWLARLLGRSTRPGAATGHAGLKMITRGSNEFWNIRSSGRDLLETALTHPSAVGAGEPHYERLEFLGDAVLDLAIADLLMRRFPEAKEGCAVERARLDRQRTHARGKGAGNRTRP